jgi:membrane-bound lytic murein transglycosylase MltF
MMLKKHRLQSQRRPAQALRRFWLAILTASALACTLFAGQIYAVADEEPSPQTPAREQFSISTEEMMKPWTGDLDGMIERRFIRVLTVYNKSFYFMDKGVQRGVTHDMFRLFEADLNKKLAKDKKLKQKHLKLHVVFIPVARKDLLPALDAGKGDIAAANLTITEERQKLVDFCLPVYPNVSEVVVSGPSSPAVSTVDDLAGKEVFTRKFSSYYESLVALNQRFATENKPAIIIRDVPDSLEDEDLIEMVNAGLIPFIVVDNHKMDIWKQVFPNITVHDSIAVHTGGEIAVAIRKESPQLKAFIDDFVVRHAAKGTTMANTVLTRYLKNAKYVKDAASESERNKFRNLIQFFQKYGDKYDVDWLLMAAQGYQESQLNHATRSPAGAIGVMQVMPATGKTLGVGDIKQIEPNIHAGIKYMRWMIDQYYGDEPMAKLDKALFSLASYNAGAGRISQLRKEAAKRGLNPNVWFHNVEYVAAEKVGAETVTYVSNIYKYYIAYQLIMEARGQREKAVEEIKSEDNKTP